MTKKSRLGVGLLAVAAILLGKIFYIQIINDRYKTDAKNNSVVYDYIYPTRGMILDRNGKTIVGNRVSYDIIVTPRELGPFDTLTLANSLDITVDYVRERTAYYRKFRSRIGYQSVVFLKQVQPETYIKFSEVMYMFPAFKSQIRSVREYPINAGGNLLGYVSEVDAAYIANHEGEYRPGDYAGKTGIEAAREKDLRGEKGYHVYLRDAHNRIQTSYNDGEMDKPAFAGHDVTTTIDADLQQYGQELMQNKVGSLVAIEPKTGEILALVSSPGIDVSQLAEINKYYSEIVHDPYKPMFNRAVQAAYPPGSVFKLVNGLIGLQEGVLEPWMAYPCNRGYQYSSKHKLGCHGHRSPLQLEEAIMMSCNGYFCYVFKNILENKKYKNTEEAFLKWRDYVCSFGFGSPLGSDFPSELGGTIPTTKRYDKMYGKNRWKFTNIISLSIGQGEIGVTPLQIANLAATVANRGYYYIPHIVKDSEGIEIDGKFKERHYTMVDTTQFKKVIQGMWRAVNSGPGSGGTASVAAVPGLDICGKTGTAQNPHGKDNSVFICFAPKDDPKIAVAAYIENAGFGATWACPIASLLVEKYLNGEIAPGNQDKEKRVLEGNLMANVRVRKQ